jgi:hypothetical protein
VIGLAIYVELLLLFSRLVRGVPARTLLEDLVTFAGACALWTGAGWMLLAGRVRPRLVAVGGLLTAVGFAALRLAALYLPDLVASNQQIVVATVVGAVLADDPGRLVGSSAPRMSAPHPLRVMPIASLGEIPISNLTTVELEPPIDRDMRSAR